MIPSNSALAPDQYYVLHLSAPGSLSGVELEDEDGKLEPATANRSIAAMRAGAHSFPLAALFSYADAAVRADGLAATLMRDGTDRIVAMQIAVTDEFATELPHILYSPLGEHADFAVSEASEATVGYLREGCFV